ncbi:MAG: hydroxyacylglutathione hydrolase [Rubrivivax sp.]|nr:MAG: hydroxyacylglutathione hydrolase [Rubrivivax sp.]
MKLVALPAFTDNYIWMLHDGVRAVVVDPGDAAPVLKALQGLQLTLDAILVTHHHLDHTGGLPGLRGVLKGKVYGPAREAIEGVDIKVREGDRLQVLGLDFTVWDTPGHTAGHVSYIAQPADGLPWPQGLVFCGDTLFSAGCGRLFDGTHEQLFTSLDRYAGLPDATWLCPTHEYTLSNLRFAQAVEPDNPAITDAMSRCDRLREREQPTLPTTVVAERAINPFLRCREPAVVAQALNHGAADGSAQTVFTALRQWKNTYRA